MPLLIFFFKQKTAYEMRISDWSSDVCSSDLSASRALVSRPSSAARTAGQVGGAMLIPGPKPVAALGKAGPAVSRAIQGAVGGAAVRDSDTSGLPERSEEHTSELQSLMRISSAVFSLATKRYSAAEQKALMPCDKTHASI